MSDESQCHRVEVCLALSAVSTTRPADALFCIDPTSFSLPTQSLTVGQDALEAAEQLLKRLTGTTPTWLPLVQVSTVTGRQDGTVLVVYSLMMPEKAPLLESGFDWVDFNTLSKCPESLLLFAYACNAYRIGVPQ